VVVGLRAAELVELGDVLRKVVCDAVGELHLVDGAGRPPLAARSVVGDDDDERVLELSALLQVVEQPADVVVGVCQEPGVDLGHPREELFLVLAELVPGACVVERRERQAVRARAGLRRSDRVDRRQLRVGRDDAELLLAGEGLLAHRFVADVEAALELLEGNVLRHPIGTKRITRCAGRRLLGDLALQRRGVLRPLRRLRRRSAQPPPDHGRLETSSGRAHRRHDELEGVPETEYSSQARRFGDGTLAASHGRYGSSSPLPRAYCTSSARVEILSFCMMWARCASAVRTEMKSFSAISWFV
jgi:hypothetical protein